LHRSDTTLATIIKRDAPHPALTGNSPRGVALDMQRLENQADNYLQEVRAAAAKIVQEANTEAAAIRQRAEQAGRDAAEQAIAKLLEEKVAARLRTLRPALEKVAQQIGDARGQWLDHWHRCGVQVACAMAERILRRELKDDVAVPQQLVREALELAAGTGRVTIKLSPTDFDHIREHVGQLAQALSNISETDIVADASVSQGGCLVATRFGQIDQRIETQLQRIAEELNA
jgi:flagellar assembly protein FliH